MVDHEGLADAPTSSFPHYNQIRWRNGPCEFYHGTFERHVDSILRRVTAPSNQLRGGGWDFGPGFYVSVRHGDAKAWARNRTDRACIQGRIERPAVIKLTIDRIRLGGLDAIWFTSAAQGFTLGDPFWDYVHFSRRRSDKNDGPLVARTLTVPDTYDLAVGPVALLRPIRLATTATGDQLWQVCFKSKEAFSLLNDSSTKREVEP